MCEFDLREQSQRTVLRRMTANSPEHFIVRGGILMRLWLGDAARPTLDLDFAATTQFDKRWSMETIRTLLSQCVADDEAVVRSDDLCFEEIWAETPSPGYRIKVPIQYGTRVVTQDVDVGYHDPIVPPPVPTELKLGEGRPIPLYAVTKETNFGWKFHELFEKSTWHSKHLYDLYAMICRCEFDRDTLVRSIRVAFESRGTPFWRIGRLFSGEFGCSRDRAKNWPRFRKKYSQLPIPENHFELIRCLVEFIQPFYGELR